MNRRHSPGPLTSGDGRTQSPSAILLRIATLLVGFVMLTGGPVLAQALLPLGFVDESVVSGLNQPTSFVALPDGRLLITEKAGLVRVVKNGGLLATPFIDLRNSVNDYWDHGLLSIAADKDFATNGYVYLLFTYEDNPLNYSGTKTGRLIRVTATGDIASPATSTTILGTVVGSSCKDFAAGVDCIPSDGASHSVGSVRVAPDGTLWVTSGDASSFNIVDDDAFRAQNLDSLAGKVLHITTTGAGIPTNPFWNGNASANRSKVWAYGVRNAYRLSLHPTTGMPYLGDVGWGDWEEVNTPVTTATTTNLGWPCYEGPVRQSGYEPKAACQALYALEPNGALAPAVSYPHQSGQSSAVTGGVFYTGTTFPPPYRGAYFFADYAVGFFRYFRIGADGLISGPVAGLAAAAGGPVYIDTDGESLVYIAINTGEVRRIRYTTPTSGITYLSDITPTSVTNGLGPMERDASNGTATAGDGRVQRLATTTYPKGLGVNAASDIRYALGGACTVFDAFIGIDEEVGTAGRVVFQVYLDSVLSYDSGQMTGATATKTVSLNVTGKNELRLVVTDGGNGIANDHADWASARVTCTAPLDTVPPTIVGTTPVAGATGASTTSPVTVTFSEVMLASTINTTTFTVTPQGSSTPIAATVSFSAATSRATLTPTVPLAGTTTYTARMLGGASGAKDLAGNPLAANLVWTFTTGAPPVPSYLSDRVWLMASNGYGPVERDQSNGENLGGDGNVITLNGVTYLKGLGVHATSSISYALNAACSQFLAVVGIDDEVGNNGSVRFQVIADGITKYDSGVMTGAMPGANVAVDISGVHTLTLSVTEAASGTDYDHADWADARVTCSAIGAFPMPAITAPASSFRYKVGDLVTFGGSATDAEDGPLTGTSLNWSVLLFHCPGGTCHIHPFTTASGSGGSFTAPDHGDENYFEITLTATDSHGNSASTSTTVQPQTVQLTLASNPPGLQLVYGGTSAASPATYTTVVGSTHTIFAPSPQGAFTFVGWSDTGAQQHNVITGATNVTYTATFSTSADTTPPTVTANTPANGATGVPAGTTVTATFSEPMNGATLTTTTVTLVPQGSSTPVPATVAYNTSNFTVTLTPTSALTAGVTYTATVKGGSSGAKDLAGNPLAVDRVWTFTTASGSSGPIYISDMTWTFSANDYGPVERDRSNGENLAGDGNVITLNGVTYAKGLGVHAVATIRVALGAACSLFTAVIGVDDEVGANGSVVFQVLGDGTSRYTSGTLTGTMAGTPISVNVTGVNELTLLVTEGPGGSDYDHADWADAQVTCTSGDTTAPTVTAITPANGATGVAVGTTVTATFSEAMTASTITTTTFTLVPQGSSTPITATVAYNATTRVATLTPSAALSGATTYTATVKSGATGVKDLANNPLATDRVWSFTTIDTTPPTVTTVTPANGATGVALNTTVTATFSEAMTASTITTTTFTLVPQGSSTPITATVGYNATTQVATLTPGAALASNTTYTATVKSGASGVKDAAGNPLATDRVWSFTTVDSTPPTVTAITPASGATGVSGGTNVTATFSEAMNAATITTTTFTLVPQGSSTPVTATVGYNATTHVATLTPSATLASNTTYTATVKSGASGVKDVAGNALATDRVWTFTTALVDTTPPTVTAVTPAAGATGVAASTTVTATFSEAMTAASITTTTFTLVPQGSSTPVTATVGYNATTHVATLTPGAALASGTTYTATVKSGASGVKDAAGNPLATDRVWTFTTAVIDTTPPTVTAITPADGATGVAASTTVTATFSEAMLAASITTTTFTLVPQGSSTPVTATVGYNATTQVATLTPGAALSASTTYVATVKSGASGVKDVAGNALAADRVWTFTTAAGSGGTIFLSDLTWTSSVNGYGPAERDRSNGENLAGDGNVITLNGVTYAKGIGVHAAALIRIPLNGTCTAFNAVIGVDDEVGPNGSVVFQVLGDGTSRYTSGTLTGTMAGTPINVDVTGVNELTLVMTEGPGGSDYDHGDWADAKVTCSGASDTTPPTVTTVTPASGATGVSVGTVATATFSEAMLVSTLNTTTVTLVPQGSSTPVAASVTYNGTTHVVTLTPSAALTGSTTYTVTVKSGSTGVKDLAGNPLATDRVWSFTTVASDTTPPTVTAITPANGATGVASGTTITATFSEPMNAATLTTTTVTLVPQGSSTPIAASVSYNSGTQTVTLTPLATLTAATTYTATVKSGASGVKDAAGNPLATDRVWSFTTAATGPTYLSDLAFSFSANGYGPVERDRSNGENLAGDGNVITLNGVTYAKGLGVHATATIRFALNGACSALTAVIGVDDEVGPNGSVVFQVLGDGTPRFTSSTLTGTMAGTPINVDVTGVNELTLLMTEGPGGSDYDHGDWADAKVTCTIP